MTHLTTCLQAIQDQTYTNVSTMIVDNASVDTTVQWLASEYPQVHLLRNSRNLGFCRGHNQALRITNSPYVVCLNPDVILSKTWIEQAVNILETQPDIGAVGGKLLRYSYSDEELKNIVPSGIIDSTGLQIFRSRHVIDRGSGEQDIGQYNQSESVFGLSGACVIFRREALETIRFKDEYFDEDFFAYKDDIDVAWRLQRMSWTCWYEATLEAYHFRVIQGQSKIHNSQIAKNFKRRAKFNAAFSYRNHILVSMKNESLNSLKPDLIYILWYELRKMVYLGITRPSTLQSIFTALKLRSSMKVKAKLLNHSAKISAREVRNCWIFTS